MLLRRESKPGNWLGKSETRHVEGNTPVTGSQIIDLVPVQKREVRVPMDQQHNLSRTLIYEMDTVPINISEMTLKRKQLRPQP